VALVVLKGKTLGNSGYHHRESTCCRKC